MAIKFTTTENKKDIMKATVTISTAKEMKNKQFKLTGVIVYDKEECNEETGEIKTIEVLALRDEKGEYMGTISPTMLNSAKQLTSIFTKEEITDGIDVIIKSGTSNSGREFFYLDIA